MLPKNFATASIFQDSTLYKKECAVWNQQLYIGESSGVRTLQFKKDQE
jgi:hypothetical protein